MTTEKYLRKVSWSNAPQYLEGARITVRFHRSTRATGGVEEAQRALEPFIRLLAHGFLGGREIGVFARQTEPVAVEVRLCGRSLVLDVVVVILRLLIEMNDADKMPSPELEDAILRVSAMRGFVPAGVDMVFEPGDEERFVDGADLVLDRISIEQAALDALLALLGLDASR